MGEENGNGEEVAEAVEVTVTGEVGWGRGGPGGCDGAGEEVVTGGAGGDMVAGCYGAGGGRCGLLERLRNCATEPTGGGLHSRGGSSGGVLGMRDGWCGLVWPGLGWWGLVWVVGSGLFGWCGLDVGYVGVQLLGCREGEVGDVVACKWGWVWLWEVLGLGWEVSWWLASGRVVL